MCCTYWELRSENSNTKQIVELDNICALLQLWNIRKLKQFLEVLNRAEDDDRENGEVANETLWRYPITSIQFAIDWTWNLEEKDEESKK